MKSTVAHILKSNEVKLEGRFRLDAGPTLSPAQVRIVENHPEFAVMEVTCGCGAKTRIRCEYTNDQSTKQRTDQKK